MWNNCLVTQDYSRSHEIEGFVPLLLFQLTALCQCYYVCTVLYANYHCCRVDNAALKKKELEHIKNITTAVTIKKIIRYVFFYSKNMFILVNVVLPILENVTKQKYK